MSSPRNESISTPHRIGERPIARLPTTENNAKKWSRPITGMMAIASRTFAMLTSAAARPMRNCSASRMGIVGCSAPPASASQPVTMTAHAAMQNIITGRLPRRSRRGPSSHRLLKPPRYAVEITSSTWPSLRPACVLSQAMVNAPNPPTANAHATFARSSFRNGGCCDIASQGTGSLLLRRDSTGGSTSGMRLRKTRLRPPIAALRMKSAANCHAAGCSPSVNAASTMTRKLARFTHAASRVRYLPRTFSGTSAVIHGSHAQLEMPRERLNAKSSSSTSASRAVASSTPVSSGTTASPPMKSTRIPQPAYTKRL